MGGVALIIPVINEGESIAAVVRDVPRSARQQGDSHDEDKGAAAGCAAQDEPHRGAI